MSIRLIRQLNDQLMEKNDVCKSIRSSAMEYLYGDAVDHACYDGPKVNNYPTMTDCEELHDNKNLTKVHRVHNPLEDAVEFITEMYPKVSVITIQRFVLDKWAEILWEMNEDSGDDCGDKHIARLLKVFMSKEHLGDAFNVYVAFLVGHGSDSDPDIDKYLSGEITNEDVMNFRDRKDREFRKNHEIYKDRE